MAEDKAMYGIIPDSNPEHEALNQAIRSVRDSLKRVSLPDYRDIDRLNWIEAQIKAGALVSLSEEYDVTVGIILSGDEEAGAMTYYSAETLREALDAAMRGKEKQTDE